MDSSYSVPDTCSRRRRRSAASGDEGDLWQGTTGHRYAPQILYGYTVQPSLSSARRGNLEGFQRLSGARKTAPYI